MNKEQLHVVLGARGAIGRSVIKELQSKNIPLKAIDRNVETMYGVTTINADLLNFSEVESALSGATHVYFCIGLPYDAKIWYEKFPVLIDNVINSCHSINAKLVFFDNIYMYGRDLSSPFNEAERQNTETKKGVVRRGIANKVLQSHEANQIQAVICRSADFYGPYAVNSILYNSFIQRIVEGKNPQWLAKSNVRHTYAFTRDNARAVVMIALDDSCYGEVWHLPVGPKVTIEALLNLINGELGASYKISYMPIPLQVMLSLFIPILI